MLDFEGRLRDKEERKGGRYSSFFGFMTLGLSSFFFALWCHYTLLWKNNVISLYAESKVLFLYRERK